MFKSYEWQRLLLPTGTPWHRLRVLPHDGTETPERLAEWRPNVHGSMRLADGKTPMPIVVTENTAHKHAPHAHLFTTAPPITLVDPSVVFEGTYPNSSPDTPPPTRRRKPPPNWIPTSKLPEHLAGGWVAVGTPVSSMQGDMACVKENMERHLLRFTTTTTTASLSDMLRWPLDARTTEVIARRNWDDRGREQHDAAYVNLISTVVSMALLQTWCVLMGRFLYQQGMRQAWPFFVRYHELSSKLYQKSVPRGNGSNARYSAEVEAAFPTFVRAATTPSPAITEELRQAHVADWQRFLVNHSFTDVLFAWLYMNINDNRAFQVCEDIRRKGHPFWMQRHFISHAFGGTATHSPTTHVVIQNTRAPRVELMSQPPKLAVLCMSHPSMRPGTPLFANVICPLERLRVPEAREAYGSRLFTEALNAAWAIAGFMTVAQQRELFRVLFTASGDGLFSEMLKSVSRDARAEGKRPPALFMMRRATLRNSSLARVVGIPMANRGLRDEGRVVYVVNANLLENVSDGRPHAFNWQPSVEPIAQVLGLADGSESLAHNSQSFFAPNHEVDTGRFYLYLMSRLTCRTFQKRLSALIQQGRLVSCLRQHPQGCLDLGLGYFSICAAAADDVCEYEVWAALLAFVYSGSSGQLPPTPERLRVFFPTFWTHLVAHWHRYLRRVGSIAHAFLASRFHALTHIERRQQALRDWIGIEKMVSAARLSRFGPSDAETLELRRAIDAFFSNEGSSGSKWLVFFFLTHVLQPVPLDPSYFVPHTPSGEIARINALATPSSPPSLLANTTTTAPLAELQHAVAHALLFTGGVLWTTEVTMAWSRYAVAHELDRDSASLVRTLCCTSHRFKSLEAVLALYAEAHTLAVYGKVQASLPDGDIDDLLLSRVLMEVDTPDFVVVLRTEKELDARACADVYELAFAQSFQFIVANSSPLEDIAARLPGVADGVVWQRRTPDWRARVIIA